MIENLTVEQEKLMNDIVTEYENLVLGGDDSYDIIEIEKGINYLYELADLKLPKSIIVSLSPLDMVEQGNLEKVETYDLLGNGYDIGWTAFYDYMQRIGIEYDNQDFEKWKNFITKSGVFATLLFENIAFVCIRPCEVHRNINDDLHNENGMAIKWRDGYGEHFLNGVSVTEELVMTPAEKLDPHIIIKEKNAEVRREIVRKIGIERVCQKLESTILDKDTIHLSTHDEYYELLNLNLGDGRQRPYLKMKNPSINTYHLEGIPPEIMTVKKALAWRNSNKNLPTVLT